MTTADKEEGVRHAVTRLLNEAIHTEYTFIVNYPRLIDHLANIDGIRDEQLSRDLEHLGKDSTRHLGLIGQIILELGGKPMWELDTIDRMTDVEDLLDTQMTREKKALSLYEEVRGVIRQDSERRRQRGFLDRLFKKENELPVGTMQSDALVSTFDGIIGDEYLHVRLIQDMVGALKMLLNK